MHASLPTDQHQDCLQYDQLVDNNILTTHTNKHLSINLPTSSEGAYEYDVSYKNELQIDNDESINAANTHDQTSYKTHIFSSTRNAQSNKIVSGANTFTSNNCSLQYCTTYAKENVWPI